MIVSHEDIEKYEKLRDAWRLETGFHSNPTFRHQNKNYQEILAMGDVAVALILKDLNQGKGDWWFSALRKLTGENPCFPEDAGLFDVLCERWITWGKGRYL